MRKSSRIIDLGGTKQGIALGLALDHQGRIVLGGNVKDGADVKGLLVRLTSAGAHDTAFSTDGIVEEEFGGADEFNHVAVDDRGRVVVGGNGGTNGAHATSGTDAIAARYTDAGALDTTFGASGKRHVDFGGASDDAEDMAIDPFGRVVIAGDDGGTDYAVGRLTADGTVDTSFDSDGVAKIDFGGTSEDGQAVAVQMDGRILAVGRTGDDFAVARLSGGGTRNYAVQDANFNTTAVTDATGKVLERYQYDPYGAATVLNADFSLDADSKQDVNLPYLWQGGALVTATGVYHFRNRDVDPRLGRATQADPLGYPDGMSRYEWEGGNPGGHLDPSGLMWRSTTYTDPASVARITEAMRSGTGSRRAWYQGWGTTAYAAVGGYGWNGVLQVQTAADQGALDGLMAWTNGFVPFVDPFSEEDFYDPNNSALAISEAMGHVSRDAWLAALTAGTGNALGGPAMNVGMGPGRPFHIMYSTMAPRSWMHAAGGYFNMTVQQLGRLPLGYRFWVQLTRIPVLSGAAAARTGQPAWFCITAAFNSWVRAGGPYIFLPGVASEIFDAFGPDNGTSS